MAEELEPVRQNIDINVNEKGADEATKDIGKLNTTITESTAATAANTKETKKAEEGFKSLKVQLKEAIVLQQKMSAQYGSTSDEAIKATKAVAGIKDEIGFQKDLVDSYNPDEKFRELTQTAGLAALALGGVKDGLAAVGIESKTLDSLIGTAQAILGVTSAVGAMSDAYGVLTASKKAKTAAEVAEIGTTEALTLAEGQATVATWSWNASLLANPAIAIAAALVALVAITYSYIKITGDAEKATALSVMQNEKFIKSLENLATQQQRTGKETEFQSNKTLAMAKANGESSDKIRALTLSLAQQETAEKKLNSAKADALVIAAERALRDSEADEETKKRLKETLEAAIKFSQEQSKILSDSYAKQRQIVTDNEVQIIQERTDARNKAIEEEKKAREKEAEDKKKAREKRLQEEKDLLKSEAQGAYDTIKELEEVDKERAQEKADSDKEDSEKAIEAMKYYADKEVEIEQAKQDQKKAIQESAFMVANQAIGLAKDLAGKNKAIQKAAIIAESAIGIGKTVQNVVTGNAAALAQGIVQAGPVAGPAIAAPAIALNTASGILSTASNIAATAKALSAIGGGGSAPSAGGGIQQPSRNVAQVGFQGSNESQISTAIAKQQKDQPPIQAYVVSQSVTDQQELDRKKELNNSF